MTIGQVISLAKNSDLKTLSIKTDDATILGFVNLGLIELYKRFPLKVSEVLLELEDDKVLYDMPDDFMWIVAAYQETDENSLEAVSVIPVNEEDNPASLNTVGWNQVQIPVVASGAYISIIYAAAPEFCMYDSEAYGDYRFYYDKVSDGITTRVYNIALPPQMIEALLEFVSFKANSAYNTPGDPNANLFYQRFENSCARIEQRGMFSSDDLNMIDRKMKGFV